MTEGNTYRNVRSIVDDILEASECVRQDNIKILALYRELENMMAGQKTTPEGGGTTILQVTDAVVESIVNCKHDLSAGPQCPMCQYYARRNQVLHDHNPVQHRDGKEPWCNICFLTAAMTEPGYKGERS